MEPRGDKRRSLHPIITQLQGIIQEHSIRPAFDEAIKLARATGVPTLQSIRSTHDFLVVMDNLLSWIPNEIQTGKYIYDQVCLTSYFILNQPPLLAHQTTIHPSSTGKPLTLLSQWIVDYAKAMGAFLDTPESLDKESLRSFYEAKNYHMEDYIVPEGGWRTFNEFFARHVKPEARPIEGREDVIVSPADSVFNGWYPIKEDNSIIFEVKGVPWHIQDLLNGSQYADSFKGGIFMHAYLDVNDYHRQHSPIAGTVLEANVVQGCAYLDVEVIDALAPTPPAGDRPNTLPSPSPTSLWTKFNTKLKGKRRNVMIGVRDGPGYQFLQTRGVIILSTSIGLVAILPVGMAQVSSVVLTCKEGQKLEKGDEISFFQYGGSDVVMVFEAGSGVEVTAEVGKHYKVGGKVAEVK